MPRAVPAVVIGVAVAVGAVALPAGASASILIAALPQAIPCGAPLAPGVWNRPDGETGSSRVKIQVRSARGAVLWSRTVRARGSWRYVRYTPRCGRTYRVTYRNPQFGTETYRVRVRR
jgi:hypothetical protein